VITPRLQLIMEKGADRRRENLPVADEIALLISGKEDKPGSREVILTARPARDTPNQVEPLHRISYTHPLYHTLHYVLLYPFSEPGRLLPIWGRVPKSTVGNSFQCGCVLQ
jgi:hypothetical protein